MSNLGKAITITREDLAKACAEADDQQHVTPGKYTWFERLCIALGLDHQDESNLPPEDVCMCGDSMEGHGYYSGHAPMSMRAHHLKEEADSEG